MVRISGTTAATTETESANSIRLSFSGTGRPLSPSLSACHWLIACWLLPAAASLYSWHRKGSRGHELAKIPSSARTVNRRGRGSERATLTPLARLRRFLRIIPALVEVSQTILERVALTTRLSSNSRSHWDRGVRYSSDSALLVFFFIYSALSRIYFLLLFFPLFSYSRSINLSDLSDTSCRWYLSYAHHHLGDHGWFLDANRLEKRKIINCW